MLPQLPPRKLDAHKGDFGRALLIGGSRGMSGAITLAGVAALRGGTGLVTLAVPSGIQAVTAAYEPSYMTWGLPEDPAGKIAWEADNPARAELFARCESSTAVGVGPGLGQSPQIEDLVAELYQRVRQPLVVDADGLNALAARPAALRQPGGPRILTPHPGEFGRLASAAGIPGHDQISQAVRFAEACRAVVVLKGHRSLITNGEQSEINATGNPGMATGGMGDILTGVITALLCQGLGPFAAAQLGCHAHGLAGDLAVVELGQVSLIASDMPRYLPAAFRALERSASIASVTPIAADV
ncbi:MAG: NAD(P)H-hydrate dehydratase [Pirellulales bacterium]|nr:NAD(P)H-hydrate dehydratase [Pirellulales bacterium]